MSECLILGGVGEDKEVILIEPERKVEMEQELAVPLCLYRMKTIKNYRFKE